MHVCNSSDFPLSAAWEVYQNLLSPKILLMKSQDFCFLTAGLWQETCSVGKQFDDCPRQFGGRVRNIISNNNLLVLKSWVLNMPYAPREPPRFCQLQCVLHMCWESQTWRMDGAGMPWSSWNSCLPIRSFRVNTCNCYYLYNKMKIILASCVFL